MTLAVITGIGTTLFTQFADAGLGADPTVKQVMSVALAALTLLGLGIFGPSIANGIVSGGPQLGAGAAAGTTLAAGATLAGGLAGARLGAGAVSGLAQGAVSGGIRAAGAASSAYSAGAAGRTGGGAAAGLANVGRSAADAATSPLRRAAEAVKQEFATGRDGKAGGDGGVATSGENGSAQGPPAWADAMRQRQVVGQGASMASQTLKAGDSQGTGANPDISEKD